MKASLPETDILLANQRLLLFEVCKKGTPRGTWARLVEGIGLCDAVQVAEREKEGCVEVGVFVQTLSGGLLYWSSKTPDVYNSLVLREGYA